MSNFSLYAHQVEMTKRHVQLLTRRNVTSDRSETGVGKTPAILVAAKELGVPFAVVAPKSILSHWRHWCMMLELRPVAILGWEACKFGKLLAVVQPEKPRGKVAQRLS